MTLNERNFDNLTFNPFANQGNILLNDNIDPDNNFFDENTFLSINAQYLSVEESNSKLTTCDSGSFFSILHVNIRSMSKNFEKFKLMLHEFKHTFSIICVTETWCSNGLVTR